LNKTSFHIINAAAGSGKTYTLVLEYLKLLLGFSSMQPYRNLLALTFTNKAVNEMKTRILDTLYDLSKDSPIEKDIQQTLCKTLAIQSDELKHRANKVLRKILLEYGSFDVITLDKFTHRIVRTFSKELNFPFGFEVILDPKNLLKEMINSIISEVGKDMFLTELILEQSLFKVAQGLSWDVQTELEEFAKLLLNENDRKPLEEIKLKSKDQHKEDQEYLREAKLKASASAKEKAQFILDLLAKNGLESSDFSRQLLHKHLDLVLNHEFKKLYTNQLELSLKGDKSLYNKKLDPVKKEIIDSLQTKLYLLFLEIKKEVGQSLLMENSLKYWTPRIILKQMEQRLEFLQNKKEVRLLGEFNQKISQLVQKESAPFIFERLGERYQHYFLDEFQDTSKLQWSNLAPLIGDALESESLSGEQGSLLIVGDPKQAIYGWRGGDIKQFIELINKTKQPFQIDPEISFLKENYRSDQGIVEFNNSLFLHLSQNIENSDFEKIYGNDSQQKTKNSAGYVSIEAILKGGKEEEKTILFLKKTIEAVSKAKINGYDEGEIAVLVRKKKQASLVGSALIEAGYSIISSESLIVSQSIEVQFIIAILHLSVRPDNIENHKLILDILWEIKPIDDKEYHEFIKENVQRPSKKYFIKLNEIYGFSFLFSEASSLPLSEAVDFILAKFPFLSSNNSFVNYFIEDIFEFSNTKSHSVLEFLEYWEIKKDDLRIAMPEGGNSIQVMTIHKAKGLEFPVVILPFMDTPIYPIKNNKKVWFPFEKKIKWCWINYSKELELYGEPGLNLYQKNRLEQELDAYNVLYVALTRPKNQLYIITQEAGSAKGIGYANLFNDFVLSQGSLLEEKNPFEWGIRSSKKNSIKIKNQILKLKLNLGVSKKWKTRLIASKKSDKSKLDAQQTGLLIHDILAKITHAEMLPKALEEHFSTGTYDENIKHFISNKLSEIIKHPSISEFYKENDYILCEKDILIPNGETIRPDRMNISKDGSASLIDYKSGKPKQADINQINFYGTILEEIGYLTINKFLVYIDNEINVEMVN